MTWRIADESPLPVTGMRTGEALGWLAEPLGHPADRWFAQRLVRQLEAVIEAASAELVVLDSVWLHTYIPTLRALGCRVVINAHNVEAELAERIASGRGDPLTRALAERTPKIERRAFEAADEVWVCSDRDADQARSRYGSEITLAVVPNTVEVDAYGPPYPPGEEFPIVYPGVFEYPPNVVAALRLADGIFPLVDVAGARLKLVGHRPTDTMVAAAARDPRIEVTGTVASIKHYLREARAVPIPLLQGGGTRFKVLEAFASGVPVVSNSLGVEGLDVRPGEHYLPAVTDRDFAASIISLAADGEAAERMTARALQLVRDEYSLEVAERRVAAAIRALTTPLTPPA